MLENEKHELIFKALADSKRRKILDFLKVKERTTGEICEYLSELDRCTVMQHLKVLEKSELVIVQKKGRFRWNYLNSLPIKEIYDRWLSQYAYPSLNLLEKMKNDLEKD